MNRTVILKSLAAAALALGTLVAATAAHARNDVQFSVTLGNPGIHVQSGPAYSHQRPAYSHNRPVYVQPAPVYVQPRPVYVQPRPIYVQPASVYGWGQPHYKNHHYGHQSHWRGPKGDYDRDGVPNRYDRYPGNPNRR